MSVCQFCSRPFDGDLCPRCDGAVDVDKVLAVLGSDRPTTLPPREIGRFRVVRPLGEGGTAVVYEALDPVLGRSLALKILKPHGLGPELVERFLREARFLGRFRHPNVVQIYELGRHEGRDFLAMELIEGRPFPATSERREAVARLARAARALGHIHRRQIVHRDLKPSNILVDASGRPVIMDFGIARSAEAVSTLSLAGSLVGTPAYMAPEQFEGETADARTDIYALGVMLYEILAGRRPYEGKTIVALAQQVREGAPAELPGVPEDLRRACLRALALRPQDRFPSADAFAEALEGGPKAAPRRPGWLRLHPRVVGAVGGALLGLLAVAVGLSLRPSTPPAAPRIDPAPFVQEGCRLSLAGRFEEAHAAFDRALEVDPAHAGALRAKGEAVLSQQFALHADRLRFPETVRALGARLAEREGAAFERRGAAFQARLARGQWEAALQAAPPDDERLQAALKFFIDGRYPGSAIRQLRETDLDHVETERDVWLLYAAVQELRPLLERFPNAGRNAPARPTAHAGLLRLQALLHEARGEKDKALAALEKAVAAAPDFLLARLERIRLLRRAESTADAAREYQLARRQAVEWNLPLAELDALLR